MNITNLNPDTAIGASAWLVEVDDHRLLLDMAGTDNRKPWDDYKCLLKELELYAPSMLEKPRLVVANKMDEAVAEENLKQFKKKVRKVAVLPISAAFDEGVEKFKDTIRAAVADAAAAK